MSITNRLKRPDLPGAIDNAAVKTASQGVADARQNLAGMNYDVYKQGAGYAGLKKSYEQQGQRAMQDTLGQMAARTGGMASSYAGSAAQQSYNNYMKTLEDAARAQFNEEYSKAKDNYNMALQDYQNAYGEYRDQVSDSWTKHNAETHAYENDREYNTNEADKAEKDARDNLYNAFYYGDGYATYQDYVNAGGKLDEATYNSVVTSATGKRRDDNRTNIDAEYESLFGAEDFNWDSWKNSLDADGDGTPGEEEDLDAFFGKSSYGADYWKQYATDEATEREEKAAEKTKTEAQDRVTDAWKVGSTPSTEDLIAAGYANEDGTLTDAGKLAKATATGLSDTELERIFGAEGFDWEEYDFDGDGAVEGADEDMSTFFTNSSYGADYWKQYATDEATRRAEEDAEEQRLADKEAKTAAQNTVSDLWAIGGNPTDDDLVTAGYKTKNEDGTYSWTTAGLSAYAKAKGKKDGDLQSLFGAEDFNWDTWLQALDVDEDGNMGENEDLEMFFANSNLGGADYWKQYATDKATEREEKASEAAEAAAQASQTSAANDITARIANGESLDDIANEYQIGVDGKTWESVTGKSQAQWQKVVNDNSIKNYTYSNDEKGATAIMNTLTNSASFSLSEKDQKNFDYIFGDGAYNTLKGIQRGAEQLSADDPQASSDMDLWYEDIYERFPRFTDEQIMAVLYKANPEVFEVWANGE